MAKLPLDPVYSKALIVASQFGCLKEMLICVAMLSVESIFYAPREKLEEVVLCAASCDSSPFSLYQQSQYFANLWVYMRNCFLCVISQLSIHLDFVDVLHYFWQLMLTENTV